MFNLNGTKKFEKKFPNLKQVINNQEYNFSLHAKIPLSIGKNTIYLLNDNGDRTVYTVFDVVPMHSYSIRVEHNYEYITVRLKSEIVINMIVGMIVSMLFQLTTSNFIGLWSLLLSFVVLIIFNYFTTIRLIDKLGIKAYKLTINSIRNK